MTSPKVHHVGAITGKPNAIDHWWQQYLALKAKVEAVSKKFPMTVGRHFND